VKSKKMLIPYETILKAKHGDSEAMGEILQHYERYINYNSYREVYDGSTTHYIQIDDEIKARIQTKLIYKIIFNFDPTKLPPHRK